MNVSTSQLATTILGCTSTSASILTRSLSKWLQASESSTLTPQMNCLVSPMLAPALIQKSRSSKPYQKRRTRTWRKWCKKQGCLWKKVRLKLFHHLKSTSSWRLSGRATSASCRARQTWFCSRISANSSTSLCNTRQTLWNQWRSITKSRPCVPSSKALILFVHSKTSKKKISKRLAPRMSSVRWPNQITTGQFQTYATPLTGATYFCQ